MLSEFESKLTDLLVSDPSSAAQVAQAKPIVEEVVNKQLVSTWFDFNLLVDDNLPKEPILLATKLLRVHQYVRAGLDLTIVSNFAELYKALEAHDKDLLNIGVSPTPLPALPPAPLINGDYHQDWRAAHDDWSGTVALTDASGNPNVSAAVFQALVHGNRLTLPSNRKRSIVVGASGYIGKATLAALTSRHKSIQAYAGVRNPEKFEPMEDVEAIKADMGDKVELTRTLRGFDTAFLVIPGHINRTELGINAIVAAHDAGVKSIVVLSVLTSGTDSIFGKQFDPIEETVKGIGIDYAIVRLPLFIDNNYANVGSIKDQGTFYDPRDPRKPHTPVAVVDVGKAVADILADPEKHTGKTYKLCSPPFSLNDMAAAFSKALGKKITATTVPYDAAKQAFVGMGFPEWQTDGILELFKYIDQGSPITNESKISDIERITGEKPMTIEKWIEENAAAFTKAEPYPNEEDEVARKLDVPVAQFIRKVEEEALAHGHENKGFLSFRNGWLPMFYPENELPEEYKEWDDMARNLTDMMSDLTLRPFIENDLPTLSATADDLDERFLFRAALVLGLTAHAYWYCGPKEPEFLPQSLKEPWDEVNRRLNRKGSYLSGEDVQLYNFQYTINEDVTANKPFDCQSENFKIENMRMLQAMWGNKAEIVFHLCFCEMSRAAAPLLRIMCHAQDAVQRHDDELMLKCLQDISKCVENIQAAFMKIIPDPNARLGIEPLVWAKTVAPVGVSFNKGMPSPSGLGTPFFHCLDVFFSRGQYASILGKDTIGGRAFFPENWLGLLNAISTSSIHVYVASSDNEELHTAWSQAIDYYASWNGMLGKHLQKTYNFLELAFKTGREKTLGGFEGGFSDRMWDKVMDMLDASREERLSAKNATLKLPLATLKNAVGEGSTQTLTYSLPHDAFDWAPGDTVAIWPSNSDEVVDRVLKLMNATGDELVDLDERWRLHLKQLIHLGMRRGKQKTRATLRDVVHFAKLAPLPSNTFQYLASFSPDIAYKGNRDGIFDVPELLRLVRVLNDDEALVVEDDGCMPGLALKVSGSLYANFISKGTKPLVEDLVATLHKIGVANIPVFHNRVMDMDTFSKEVYPIFEKLVKRRGRTIGHVVDLFCPIEPRQYSIANLKNEKDKVLKLVIGRLSYKKSMAVTKGKKEADWKATKRSTQLAQKYFKRWKMNALSDYRQSIMGKASPMDLSLSLLSQFDSEEENQKILGVASNYISDGGDIMFTITPNLGFHAPSTSEPLLMVAAGSGVSPFLGYIEQRIAERSTSDTILLWSVPYMKEGLHILKDLERMLEGSDINIDIIVSVSRESVWPILKDGRFVMESRPKCRITEFLERNTSIRKKLQNLLLPTRYNGLGGFTYLCGSATFVRNTLDSVSEVLMDISLFEGGSSGLERLIADSHGKLSSEQWLIQELQSDEKIIYEVFNDKAPSNPPSFTISQLVMKNDPAQKNTEGLWLSIYGEIYDVSTFVHPGGERILQTYSGMDCTVAWEAVRHHRSQSLNAKLATLYIGKLKTPKFAPLPLLKLDENTTTDLNGVFNIWAQLLFDIVEIENAMRLEYRLDMMHIAGSPHATVLTPMKIQMLYQAHRRFVFSHLGTSVANARATAERFKEALRNPQELSDGNLGLGDFSVAGAGMMNSLLDEITSSDATKKMLASCNHFVEACHCGITAADLELDGRDRATIDYLANTAYALKSHDLKLLSKWKSSLRMVMVYLEKRDSQDIPLPQFYHTLQTVSNSMMVDLKTYISRVSSPLLLSQLWEIIDVSSCDVSKMSVGNWFKPTKPPQGNRVLSWQASTRKD